MEASRLDGFAKRLASKVPYFRARGAEAFRELPLITKHQLIDNAEQFISDDFGHLRVYLTDAIYNRSGAVGVVNHQIDTGLGVVIEQTTGTTGMAGRFPKTKIERAQIAMEIWRARIALDQSASRATFTPFVHFPPGTPKDPRIYSDDPDKVAELYVDIRNRGGRWLHVQPSLLRKHLKLLRAKNVTCLRGLFQYIELTGEAMSLNDRAEVAEFFGATIVNQYGCIETWAIGYDVIGDGGFSLLTRNVHVELVKPESGQEIHAPGELGKVVVTALKLELFPIVRYMTGDRGEWIDGPDGRRLKLNSDREANLLRVNERLVSGTELFRVAMNMAFARLGYFYFEFIQFIQMEARTVEVHMSSTPKAEIFVIEIARAMRELNPDTLSINLSLTILSPEQVRARCNGKSNLFVSRLPFGP